MNKTCWQFQKIKKKIKEENRRNIPILVPLITIIKHSNSFKSDATHTHMHIHTGTHTYTHAHTTLKWNEAVHRGLW